MPASDSKSQMLQALGMSIFYASIQASIGSVELSSKYSILNFSKDQETLQRGADALKGYIMVGTVWMLGSMLVLYSNYGNCGAVFGLLANLIFMGWIVLSYLQAFKVAAQRYNLQYPKIF
jgi:hypothetical protein